MLNRSLAFLTNTKKFLKNTVKLGYDTCHRTHGYDASPCYKDCKELQKQDFAKNSIRVVDFSNVALGLVLCIKHMNIKNFFLEETKSFVMNVDIAVLYLSAQQNMDQLSNLPMSQ